MYIKVLLLPKMRQKLQTICALLLCGIFLYNTMGYMVVYSSIRMILRQQTFAKLSNLPDTALTAFTISNTKHALLLKGSSMPEIKIDGKMFDIVRQKDNGDSTTYFCLRDNKEEQLILKANLITGQTKSGNPFSRTTRLMLDQIIKTALLSENQGLKDSLPVEYLFGGENHYYARPMLPVPAPPPQQYC